MLIPGFMAGDLSLGLMARWLRDRGYRPTRAGMRANVDCTEVSVGRLEAQLESAYERHGRPVSVIGHSRGGTMARILGVRRPDIVRSVITLGSPLTDQFDVHPFVRAQVRAVATLGTLGVPGLFAHRCRSECCAQAMDDITGPFPEEVAFHSIYSRWDGIVAWKACLDPYAEHVEVRASHIGMAVNADVYRAVGLALASAEAGSVGASAVTGGEALAA